MSTLEVLSDPLHRALQAAAGKRLFGDGRARELRESSS